ncbi:MAG TPA: hypothetical protein DDX39_07475 [Bacteroidales bacterium]|nr:MAG: hypothetical protein A2W98_02120 [Bacteroidetes bacterium GWF2_33_38]OFY73316.1 MAG: hypothetical protein A2265_02640 [Bacteroidetes bacterium RIFOXYA12_FULL_33_9]OFY89022.1 MAG: hypothetical protein A2236_12555 [Bacteroidetes bacterium RIFOXYA2_FULL_33_7]HBF88464.1 hypothetical protein [Bacteroidales bacterium]
MTKIFFAQTKKDTLNEVSFELEKYFNTSLTEEERKHYKDAIYMYSQKIHKNPTDASAYLNRGAAYAELGLYPYALSDYNHCLKIDSTLSVAYYNRALAKARFSYNKNACIDIKKAIEYGLELAEPLFNEKCLRYSSEIGMPKK